VDGPESFVKHMNTSSRIIFVAFALCISLTVAACPPSPVSPGNGNDGGVDTGTDPILDAHAATLYQRACSNLASLGCPEGIESSCLKSLEHAQTARLSDFKPECLASASSKTAVRDCCKGATGACSKITCN
jgi:hypothetical protein